MKEENKIIERDFLGRFVKGSQIGKNTQFKKDYLSEKKGKTFEELYGKEKARMLKKEHSNIMQGKISPMCGKKHSQESIRKIKEARAKQITTEETKRKASERMKGNQCWKFRKDFSMSEERKRKIGESNKGKKRSEETRIRIGKSKKGQIFSKESSEKKRQSMLGKKHTEETKEKIRIARIKQIVPMKDTLIELKIQNLLSLLHIEYFTHKYISEINHSYQCDILIPKQEGINQKTIIECDGCFFHCCPICKLNETKWTKEQREIDIIRTKELSEKGFKVLRLWGHKIKVIELNELKQLLGVKE